MRQKTYQILPARASARSNRFRVSSFVLEYISVEYLEPVATFVCFFASRVYQIGLLGLSSEETEETMSGFRNVVLDSQ